MRDWGWDFYWNDAHTENLVARGFEDTKISYDAIVAFEVMEHLLHPLKDLERIFEKTGIFLFSTELYGRQIPQLHEWDYYAPHHGQHITFFQEKTLSFLAKKMGLYLSSDGATFHILSKKKISPHLVLLAKGLRKLGFVSIVRKFLKSKTQSDSSLLIGSC
jgi:hypothetical protein